MVTMQNYVKPCGEGTQRFSRIVESSVDGRLGKMLERQGQDYGSNRALFK